MNDAATINLHSGLKAFALAPSCVPAIRPDVLNRAPPLLSHDPQMPLTSANARAIRQSHAPLSNNGLAPWMSADMAFAFRSANKDPDTRALKRLGEAVRARLAADPQVYQMPVEGLELYGVGGFFSPAECDRLIAIVDTAARPSPTYHNNGDSGRTSFSGDSRSRPRRHAPKPRARGAHPF